MTVLLNRDEETFLKERAAMYQNKGYSVQFWPSSDQLPDFLRDFPIDLIAKNGSENVIIEARTLTSLQNDATVTQIAGVVKAHSDWRFELIMVKEKPLPLPEADPNSILNEVESLQETRHSNAAFLLIWGAIEIGLRKIVSRENIELKENSTDYLVKGVATYGWIEDDIYITLWDALPVRNAVAHGYEVEEDLAALVEKLLTIARTLN